MRGLGGTPRNLNRPPSFLGGAARAVTVSAVTSDGEHEAARFVEHPKILRFTATKPVYLQQAAKVKGYLGRASVRLNAHFSDLLAFQTVQDCVANSRS
jgi:hypothetical protein